MLATGVLTIEHKASLGFVFDTPDGMKLLSCEIGGKPVSPVDLGEGILKVTLAPTGENSRLTCSFTGRTTALDPVEGTMKLALPESPALHPLADLASRSASRLSGGNPRQPQARSGHHLRTAIPHLAPEKPLPGRTPGNPRLLSTLRPQPLKFPTPSLLMKLIHLLASLAIVACTTLAWFLLGAALSHRTTISSATMQAEVAGVWGPAITQQHPQAWFETPNAPGGKALVLPSSSQVTVTLASEPKRRGLLWHRTYDVEMKGDYVFTNPTKIPQTFYISFPLPRDTAGLHGFEFRLGENDDPARTVPGTSGVVTRAILLPASASVTLHTGYRTRGTDTWRYEFPDNRRIAGFNLTMRTNFPDINFPVGTGSPSERTQDPQGFTLVWNYPDVLAAPPSAWTCPSASTPARWHPASRFSRRCRCCFSSPSSC